MIGSIGRQFAATEQALNSWAAQQKSTQSMSVDAWANLIEQGAWPPGNGKGGPSHPYQQIAAVFRAVNFIAGSIASLPFHVSDANENVLESGPLIELIDNPAPGVSAEDFWLQTAGWLMLSGRVHWVFTRTNGGVPSEMLPVGGAQTKPIVDKTSGELLGWEYQPAGANASQKQRLNPDEVWTIRVPNFEPANPQEGIGITDVVRRAVNQVWKADSANENSLDNDVEPGGALQTDASLTEAQRDEIKQQVNEKHAGHRNRRRFMLLEGGLKYERTQATFSEMEFSTLRQTSVSEIAAAYGVDKTVLGYPPEGGRFEYAKQAKQSAWIDRILPFADWLAGQFDRGVISRFTRDRSVSLRDAKRSAVRDPKVRASPTYGRVRQPMPRRQRQLVAWFDSSNVPAVKDTIASRVETAGKMVSELKATPEDAIELFDLGLPVNEWQKQGWQKATEMPIGEPMPGEQDQPGDESGEEEGEAGWQQKADDDAGGPATVQAPDERPEARQRLWAAWRSSWDGLMKQMEKKYRGRVRKWRRTVLRQIEKLVPERSARPDQIVPITCHWFDVESGQPREAVRDVPADCRDVIAELMFDVVAAERELLNVTGPIVREAVRLGGQQTMDEVAAITDQDEADPFNIRDEEAQAAIRRRRMQIKGQPRRVAERLRASLAEGLEKGEGQAELTKRVKDQMNIESSRARTVAFQETSSAVEESRQVGKEQANVPLKSWLWSHKETGRPSHAATENATMDQPIPRDDDFQIVGTGYTAPYPRAVGVAEQDINCGCTSISRFPDDQAKSIDHACEKILAFGVATPEAIAKRFDEPESKEADHAAEHASA